MRAQQVGNDLGAWEYKSLMKITGRLKPGGFFNDACDEGSSHHSSLPQGNYTRVDGIAGSKVLFGPI